MKARMSGKSPEAANYLCTKCGKEFAFRSGSLTCPKCESHKRSDFVPIYMKNDPEEEGMYTDGDFHGG